MKRHERDPQVELVRRYARILRSAPAEAWGTHRASSAEGPADVGVPTRFGARAPSLRAVRQQPGTRMG
jgi:hypothetical protein